MPAVAAAENPGPPASLLAIARDPVLYLLAALIGSLIPVNRGWSEPDARHHHLPRQQRRPCRPRPAGRGAGPRLAAAAAAKPTSPRPPPTPNGSPSARASGGSISKRRAGATSSRRTIWAALTGGERVMHVEWIRDPGLSTLAPSASARRNIAACGPRSAPTSSSTADGKPLRIDHPGYGPHDAFYHGVGKASAIKTCNQWVGRAASASPGSRPALWSPFAQGLLWRYRRRSGSEARSG